MFSAWRRSSLKQFQIAQRLGVNKVSVSNWIRGKRRPPPEYLAGLCGLLRLDLVNAFKLARHPLGAEDLTWWAAQTGRDVQLQGKDLKDYLAFLVRYSSRSQAQIARSLGCAPSTISRWLTKDELRPDPMRLADLCLELKGDFVLAYNLAGYSLEGEEYQRIRDRVILRTSHVDSFSLLQEQLGTARVELAGNHPAFSLEQAKSVSIALQSLVESGKTAFLRLYFEALDTWAHAHTFLTPSELLIQKTKRIFASMSKVESDLTDRSLVAKIAARQGDTFHIAARQTKEDYLKLAVRQLRKAMSAAIDPIDKVYPAGRSLVLDLAVTGPDDEYSNAVTEVLRLTDSDKLPAQIKSTLAEGIGRSYAMRNSKSSNPNYRILAEEQLNIADTNMKEATSSGGGFEEFDLRIERARLDYERLGLNCDMSPDERIQAARALSKRAEEMGDQRLKSEQESIASDYESDLYGHED